MPMPTFPSPLIVIFLLNAVDSALVQKSSCDPESSLAFESEVSTLQLIFATNLPVVPASFAALLKLVIANPER